MTNATDDSHDLTQSLEDYLETIYELTQTEKVVRSSCVADRMGVKRPSVTSALKALAEKGYVVYLPYVPIALTELGEKEAKKIIRRHAAMEIFLERILGVDAKTSKESACRLEHAMNDEITTRLVEFVEFVDSCPRVGASLFRRSDYHCREKNNDQFCAMCIHGCLDEIVHSGRTVDLSSVHRAAQTLNEASAEYDAVILARIPDDLQERPEFSATNWRPNKTLRILRDQCDAATLTIRVDDQTFVVSRDDAEKIEVVPCE